jgi:hypothetical protein
VPVIAKQKAIKINPEINNKQNKMNTELANKAD